MNKEERRLFWSELCSYNANVEEKSNNIRASIHFPKYLYRYRPITISTIDALQTNQLFFSKASFYDDPFDSLIHIDYAKLREEDVGACYH